MGFIATFACSIQCLARYISAPQSGWIMLEKVWLDKVTDGLDNVGKGLARQGSAPKSGWIMLGKVWLKVLLHSQVG